MLANHAELEKAAIHLDSLLPDLLSADLQCPLGCDPGEYLFDSLLGDIVKEYLVEESGGAPGVSSERYYLDYERRYEIIKELKSRGYNVVRVLKLPF